ncbi:Serine/threonine-protein kinase smg1, partial [Blyttiomyces sp. JEL0837]
MNRHHVMRSPRGPQRQRERGKDFKLNLLAALREALATNASNRIIKPGVLSKIISDLQVLLDTMETADLLPLTLDVVHLIQSNHVPQFRNAFKDLVSVLIGWQLDPTISKASFSLISDSLKKFWPTWRERLKFGLDLLKNLSGDLRREIGLNTDEIPRVNPEAGSVLAANPYFMQELRGVISKILNLVSRAFPDSFLEMQLLCLNILSLDILSSMHLLEDDQQDEEQILLEIERKLDFWLDGILQVLSYWSPHYSEDVLRYLITPGISDLFLVRLKLSKSQQGLETILSFLERAFQIIGGSGVEYGLGQMATPEILLEIRKILAELCGRHKLLVPGLQLIEEDHREVTSTIGESIAQNETACLESLVLFDLVVLCNAIRANMPGYSYQWFHQLFILLWTDLKDANPRLAGQSWWIRLQTIALYERFNFSLSYWPFSTRKSGDIESSVINWSEDLSLIRRNILCDVAYDRKVLCLTWFKSYICDSRLDLGDLDTLPNEMKTLCVELAERIEYEIDSELLQSTAELMLHYHMRFGFFPNDFKENPKLVLALTKQLQNRDSAVRAAFANLVTSLDNIHLLQSRHYFGTGGWRARISGSINLGTFRSRYCGIVLSMLRLENPPQGQLSQEQLLDYGTPIGFDYDSLERLLHASQFHRLARYQSNKNFEIPMMHVLKLSEDELIFWALWETARYLVSSRLRTPLGNPQQTFESLEQLIIMKTSLVQQERNSV